MELEVKEGEGVGSWIPHSHHSLALASYSQFPLTLPQTAGKALAVVTDDGAEAAPQPGKAF